MLASMVQGTWTKALGSITSRSRTLASLGGSPSLRAIHWNSYVVSCTLYPAHVAPPDGAASGQLRASLGRCFPRSAGIPASLLP
eukprot:4331206-Alexandrium_andersonii.AAC.1